MRLQYARFRAWSGFRYIQMGNPGLTYTHTTHSLDPKSSVGASVSQIPEKDEPPLFWMRTIIRIAKMTEEITKSIDFTMNVAHDVDWTFEE